MPLWMCDVIETQYVATLFSSSLAQTGPNLPRKRRVAQPYDPHHHSDLENVENIPVGSMGEHSSDEEFHKDEDLVAREMAQKVRVLCWIIDQPQEPQKKGEARQGHMGASLQHCPLHELHQW
ncbi:unnamed protein product [Timema podura]|uniref:Uncharacterized protein n=1 Tax=Timema podura TaxID=61482 RepID=A0ABN7NQ36_TIMPD|nr:unnamed protein product [Timema podura]